ncbi:nuclear transport factor 2 family protein [Massilia varians]|uniref:nuclear transport factor 2 family protein n=1 Tax=Massilia varians TaxID=457921 RepID=UPI0025522B62|nr:nuclear transport factor 2 family protein [Massilia varians]MDK6077535.1 nuclear transport factor 2 family protein [Massilia varians]
MKRTIGITILFTLLPAMLPAQAAGFQSQRAIAAGEVDVPAMLAGMERQRAKAIVQRDIATLRHLMDREYYHVDSRGRVRSKTELLTALDRNDFRFRLYEIDSTEVHPLEGGNAALVTGTYRALMVGDAAKPLRFRFAHLWIRQPDGWKNSFHQSTAIRPAQDD